MYVDGQIAQNYMEYLHCPTVDFELCEDFPCEEDAGDVLCTIINVHLTQDSVTINSVVISFTPPIYAYIIQIIRVSDGAVIDTKTNPTSPVTFTGLVPATNYIVKLTTSCPGNEIRITQLPVLTMPICVIVEDLTGIAEDVNEYT